MINSKVKSPITNGKTKKILTIATKDILNSYKAAGLFDVAQPYVSKVDEVEIYECVDTGYRFYYPFNIFGDDKFYEQLQKNKEHYYHMRWEFGPALDAIRENDKVLEVGCGHGDFLALVAGKTNDALGLELNKEAIKAVKSKGLVAIDETIQSHSQANPGVYDVVCMFQVLEHIWEVRDFLESSVRALKPGGLLIIGVPNNNPYLFKRDVLHALNLPPHHSGLWNKRSLRALDTALPVQTERIMTEPLSETELYWKIQKQYWQKSRPMLYNFANMMPAAIKPTRNMVLKKLCQGRNVLGIYRKLNGSK